MNRRSPSTPGVSLYDTPGPRTRRAIRIWTVVVIVVVVAAIAAGLVQFAAHGQLAADRWTPFLTAGVWQYLLVGLGGTIEAAAIVAVLGGLFGVLLAVGRVSSNRVAHWLSTAYIEIFRTIPVLLLIYLMLFGLPQLGLNFPVLWKLAIPLTLANAAAFAEIIRAGILGLPSGQSEAALSLGLSPAQTMRMIVLPQAMRFVAPSLVTQLVSLVKDTSLGYIVAFTELLYRGQVLSAYNHFVIPTFVVVTLIYLVFNGSLSTLASRLRLRPSKRTIAPPRTSAPTVGVPVTDDRA
ncbi:amino acid ABC transporter permease [Lacisediminihabitans changchengi]|uniref:Amino acid ABC transporter permease n=1 Tax=Lacisediminihabitans changchengi TaxID=2787634 RepID=A0A934SIM3_9MICO|nr:amino acid ABC transporter permease [Lacisediminihabitans changchengi]MBK4346074.1 amino acid ABC transporter permease [Lacisediminihabitans changchengi]